LFQRAEMFANHERQRVMWEQSVIPSALLSTGFMALLPSLRFGGNFTRPCWPGFHMTGLRP
jgi:hypothetical protein